MNDSSCQILSTVRSFFVDNEIAPRQTSDGHLALHLPVVFVGVFMFGLTVHKLHMLDLCILSTFGHLTSAKPKGGVAVGSYTLASGLAPR